MQASAEFCSISECMQRIRMLDGCAGIGGNSYAFHSFARTALYSEIDSNTIAILKGVMRKGYIDTAPVTGDIAKLDVDTVRACFGSNSVDMLTAGWPCQGTSVCGAKRGLEDCRSSLVKDIMSQVAAFDVSMVFLENVPAVLSNGSARFVADAFAELGYALAWGVLSADDVGFRHQRKRWFCLAVKHDRMGMLRSCLEVSTSHQLSRGGPEPARMALVNEAPRLRVLGNGVVPHAVKRAFELLGAMILDPRRGAPLLLYTRNLLPFKWVTIDASGCRRTMRRPVAETSIERFPPLMLLPDAYDSPLPPSRLCNGKFITKPIPLSAWSTPRHANFGASNYLTTRSMNDLGTQIRFEQDTPDALRGGYISVHFLEWLMGYPLDYTNAGS